MHVVRGDSEDPVGDFIAINQELELFNPKLALKTQVHTVQNFLLHYLFFLSLSYLFTFMTLLTLHYPFCPISSSSFIILIRLSFFLPSFSSHSFSYSYLPFPPILSLILTFLFFPFLLLFFILGGSDKQDRYP